MVKKNLIIGAFSGYSYKQLCPWIKSLEESGFVGDKVLIVFGQIATETATQLREHGIELVAATPSKLPIHVDRFGHMYDYLETRFSQYKYVITTDVRDVYFQANPVTWLSTFLGEYDMVTGSECIQYCHEPWGNQNLLETYGPYFYEKFKNNTIYNVGVLGGTAEFMKDMFFHIYQASLNRPIPIVDQAVFNVLIQSKPFRECTKFAKQEYGWACHAGTVADPTKLAHFKPYLLENEPKVKDNLVYANSGPMYLCCIVHQYDRVPAWKKYIEEKYS